MELKHKELTEVIIRTFYEVYSDLGHGFLEQVYQNSMFLALQDAGLKVDAQRSINVFFRGRKVGQYFADLVVNDVVIVELKAAITLAEEHEIQLTNYLKATTIEVGLLLNFGSEPQFKRKAWFNNSNT